ncbi:MAG TPA: response regulator transcription factor [Aestuariivirgaceae bacterium]|jgi:two-component system phosphate regulon response regulator OmpR
MPNISDTAPHILVIDDDRRIRELLASYLANHGLRVTAAANTREARERMRGLAFDLIVLDIMMAGESGIDLARSIRNEKNRIPILMLSALGEIPDRVNGLQAGGDDYLPKPFEPMELLLRIRSILRRTSQSQVGGEVRFGTCTFHVNRGELRRNGQVVRLTTRERELMRLFVERAGQAIARNELMQASTDEHARTIDVQINRLRRKIEADPTSPVYLQTIRGAGYTLYLD